MKRRLKNAARKLYQSYVYRHNTVAFQKRYKNIDHKLFIKTLSSEQLNRYKSRWSVFGQRVEVDTFLLCYNLSGKIDYNIVPENLFATIIEPSLNSKKELSFFSVKNVYEKWFDNFTAFPKAYLHKIDGIYYDSNFNLIPNHSDFIENTDIPFPVVLKPSRDTNGGEGVKILYTAEQLTTSLTEYNDMVCQELIYQNEYLSSINPGINSIRTCLYRTATGAYKVINNSIRFGVDGGLDNETGGGIVCNINDEGWLNHYALNKYADKYFSHPNSHVRFSDIQVPLYNELNTVAEKIANQLPLSNLLSLDMCLDQSNSWRCIEINVKGQTIRFAQYAGKGFFGNYTDEVIKKCLVEVKQLNLQLTRS